MARQNADIELLFGVKGGGSIKEGTSGALIRDQLNGIVGQINRTPLEIKFKADESSLKNLRDQIKKIMGTINVKVGATDGTKQSGGSGGSSGGKSSGSTGAMKDKALDNALQKIEKLQHQLSTTKIKLDNLVDVDGADEISKKIESISTNIEKFKKTTSNGMGKTNFENEFAKYSREVSGAKNEVAEFTQKTTAAAKAQKALDASLKETESELEDVKFEFRQSSEASSKMTGNFSQLTKDLLGFYSLHTIIMKVASAIKDMVNNAIELETAFSDTRIVTHATDQEMKQLRTTITETATETAASIESLVSATTAYARLGYSLEESTILAKYTGMLEKVGNVDTQRAEDAITSIVKAFPNDVDVTNIERTMDKLIKTGNNFPISVAQIATGMTNASSALASAGNSFEQSVALLTAANTTVQNAEKSSTALRTMAARIRKTEADIGEDGEAITDAKHEELIRALTKHHVKLTNLNNEYRSTYDIMRDIAAHWHEMTSMEQSAVAELVAGTRQQVVFYSIIENFREASNAMEAMADSAGTLQESYNVYLNTAAAHIEQFNIAWQTFSVNFVNGNATKAIINIGSAILGVADSLQRVHLLIPTIIAGVNAFKGLKFAADIAKQKSVVDALVNTMLTLTDVENGTVGVTKQTASIFNSLSYAQQALVVETLQNVDATRQQGAQAILTAMETQGLADSELMAAGATDSLNISIKSLMASNPVGWIMLAASAAISIGMAIYDVVQKNNDAVESIDEINEHINELSANASQAANDLRELNDKTAEIIPRFAELAKGVDQYGQKTEELTDDEYKEFVSLSNQLAELFPEIAFGMDESGNAMLDLNYQSSDLADTLWRIVDAQKEMARLEIAKQMSDAVSEAQKADSLYKQQETDINNAIEALKEFRKAFSTTSTINEYSMLGEKDFTETIDAIRKVSPEIDDVLDKLGKTSEASGTIAYQLFGNGGQYLNLAAFTKDIDKILDHTEARFAAAERHTESNVAWNLVKQTAVSWAKGQQDYIEASETLQSVIDKMIGDVDLSGVDLSGKNSENSLQNYLYDNIIEPVSKMSVAGREAMSSFNDAFNMFNYGKTTVGSITESINALRDALGSSIPNAQTVEGILEAMGATDLQERIEEVRSSISGEADDINAFFDGLSYSDLDVVYSITTESGSITLDELKEKLLEVGEAAEDMGEQLTTSLNLDDFLNDLQDSVSKIDSITSAMEKLQKGTALTTSELIKLAQQFPELLTQSDLFSDGSIEGQRRMLTFLQDAHRKEYEMQVDTKIAELKVTMEAMKSQVNLEKEKQKLRLTIYTKALAGQISTKTKWLKEVALLDTLESQNFAELKDGEVSVNEAALNKMAEGTNTILDATVNGVWNEYGKSVAKVHGAAAYAGLEATGRYAEGTVDILNQLSQLTIQSYQNGAMEGAGANVLRNLYPQLIDTPNIFYTNGILSREGNYYSLLDGSFSGSQYNGSVRKLTSGYGSITDWYNENSKNTLDVIREWESLINSYQNEITNLEALKNYIDYDLKDTVDEIASSVGRNGSSSSSSSSSKNDPIAGWYRASKHYIETKTNAPHFDYVQFIYELSQMVNEAIKNGTMTKEDAFKYLEEIAKAVDGFKTDMEKAIDNLVQYRIKAIKSVKEEQKKALNEELTALKKKYDEQKELLRKSREEEKTEDERQEKRDAVSSLETQMKMLSYDNSAWAQSKYAELTEELKQAKKALEDFEKDNELSLAEQFLDDQYALQEKEISDKISEIDEFLKDPTALYNIALQDIQSNSKLIYEELKEYGRLNGDGKHNEAVELWEAAADAIAAYEKYLNVTNQSYYYEGTYSPNPDGWLYKNDIRLTKYASGTRNATRGYHRIDERGSEMIFESESGKKYKLFSGGEMVLNAEASKFLYEFANSLGRNAGAIKISSNMPDISAHIGSGSGDIRTGDIIINGNVDRATISEIRRLQRDQMTDILKELNRLKT